MVRTSGQYSAETPPCRKPRIHNETEAVLITQGVHERPRQSCFAAADLSGEQCYLSLFGNVLKPGKSLSVTSAEVKKSRIRSFAERALPHTVKIIVHDRQTWPPPLVSLTDDTADIKDENSPLVTKISSA